MASKRFDYPDDEKYVPTAVEKADIMEKRFKELVKEKTAQEAFERGQKHGEALKRGDEDKARRMLEEQVKRIRSTGYKDDAVYEKMIIDKYEKEKKNKIREDEIGNYYATFFDWNGMIGKVAISVPARLQPKALRIQGATGTEILFIRNDAKTQIRNYVMEEWVYYEAPHPETNETMTAIIICPTEAKDRPDGY